MIGKFFWTANKGWTVVVVCAACVVKSSSSDVQTTDVYDLDKPAPVVAVEGVAGQQGALPCGAGPGPAPGDQLAMVLWFKDEEPIYSYDIRNRSPSSPRLWSPGGLSSRALFRPPRLLLHEVQVTDAGLYRCRVDFKNSPTLNYKINFTVISLPSRPTIRDAEGRVLTSLVQTFNEGDTVQFSCETEGGNPLPQLTWYLENEVLPSTPIPPTKRRGQINVTANQVTLRGVGRGHQDARLVCEARNTALAPPRQRVVVLDLQLKPLSVEIVNKIRLSSGRGRSAECQSRGSRPPALLTWWRDGRLLKHEATVTENGTSISRIWFTPEAEDHEATLVCRAENTVLNVAIEDSWKLDVQYVPIVSLRLDPKVRPNELKEYDDVFFECSVNANPKAWSVSWSHNEIEIRNSPASGIIVSNQSLVLRNISRRHSGEYRCSAHNLEGTGVSNLINLDVRYPPKCKESEEVVIGALNNETILLRCEMDSNPDIVNFTWLFDDLTKKTEIPPGYYNSNGSFSILRYTPETESGFGTILCVASNALNDNNATCLYKVIYADRPSPPENCSVIRNASSSDFLVECDPGFDGGMPQLFHAEVYAIRVQLEFVSNLTAGVNPVFNFTNLDDSCKYIVKVYASNAKGRSEVVKVATLKASPTERYIEDDVNTSQSLTPSVVVVISLSVLVTAACFLTAAAKCRNCALRRRDNVKMIPVVSTRSRGSNTYRPAPSPSPSPAPAPPAPSTVTCTAAAAAAGEEPDLIPCHCAGALQEYSEYESMRTATCDEEYEKNFQEIKIQRGTVERGVRAPIARRELPRDRTPPIVKESCI